MPSASNKGADPNLVANERRNDALQINVTARAENITQAMRKYAEEKANKLHRYFGQIHSIDVLLLTESDLFVAEVKIAAGRGRHTLVGKEVHADMNAAIDLVTDKMERQLTKLKEKTRDHRATGTGEASSSEVTDIVEPEETYEDVIRNKEF